LPKPPGLDEFPVDINRVIEMKQQAFAAIEKAQPEKVVIYKGRSRVGYGVPQKSVNGLTNSAFLVE
jgi:hypothetical protein